MSLSAPRSIRIKLFSWLFGLTFSTILAVSLLSYQQITRIYRQSYRQDLLNQAIILGANCQASLTFNLPEDATAVLAKLSQHPAIAKGKIFDKDGRLFAKYDAGITHAETTTSDLITVRQPIIFNHQSIGTIELQDTMLYIRQFRNHLIFSLLIIVVTLLAIFSILTLKISAIISGPVLALTRLTARVAEDSDYSQRVEVTSDDEIGQLGHSMNSMLATIQEQTAELNESERRFRMVVEHGVDAFFMHDMEGHIVNVNRQACTSLGYSREELLQMTVADIDGDSVPRKDMEKVWHTLEAGKGVTIDSHHRRRDGTTFPVEVRLGVLKVGEQKYILGTARDVSERFAALEEKHAIELQLQQAQKMESIGTLAGGIAHDFNNILSAIMGFTELAKLATEPKCKMADYLDQIHNAGQRATELVKQILTFSRKKAMEKSPLQISLIVKEALKLLRASIPSTITIEQDITSEAKVLADSTQIHQVVMNLCTNAYHAMADTGGVLSVSLREIDVDTSTIDTLAEIPPGRYIVLSVSDTGCGMDATTKAKIFEPYFTTKEQGRGTGLGLAVTEGIVKDHQGRIGVYSEPGEGTTFHVYLPIIIAESRAPLEQKPVPPGHGERVMVVDDEETIRTLTCQFLQYGGYKCENFANGHEAWEALAAAPQEWDMLITDRTMPQMTGEQLISKVQSIRPDMPIILATGYISGGNGSAKEIEGVRCLTKPIARRELMQCLAELRESL